MIYTNFKNTQKAWSTIGNSNAWKFKLSKIGNSYWNTQKLMEKKNGYKPMITSPTKKIYKVTYFEKITVRLHVLYVLNKYIKFHTNWMLFII